MNKHVEKAKELRNATPMVHNCAQTIMEVYADDLGINKELANHLGCNFGGGMKCGSVCGAITSGLMILGAKGIDSPAKVNQFIKTISNNHHGLIKCHSAQSMPVFGQVRRHRQEKQDRGSYPSNRRHPR
jgi:hypothetical protein